MIRNLHKHNRIFATGLSLLLTVAMIFAIPASAAENDVTHAVDSSTSSHAARQITLPVSQTWSGGSGKVTYTIKALGAMTDSGWSVDTASDVAAGNIAWTIEGTTGTNPGSFDLDGETKTGITYTWNRTGLYLFDLGVDATDGGRYTYDHTAYRIRVYVRNDNSFITVQNIGSDGKVAEIVYRHSYSAPSDSGDGGTTDGGGDNGGGNDTPSTPTTPTTPRTPTDPTNNIDESGSTSSSDTGNVGLDGVIQDIIQSITEWGNTGNNNTNVDSDYAGGGTNHSNSYTGDDSNMILYGSISILAIITLIVWFIKRKHA